MRHCYTLNKAPTIPAISLVVVILFQSVFLLSSTAPAQASSASPSEFGQPVTFTAMADSGQQFVTGEAAFITDSTTVEPFTRSPGALAAVAQDTVPLSIDSPDQSAGGANTTMTISAIPNPSVYREAIDLTVVVAAVAPGQGTPTGTVQFKADGANIGSAVPLGGGGNATISTSTLLAGPHVITVDYSGDTQFNTNMGTLSPDQVVGQAATLTTILAIAPNPSVVGQSVTINFAVMVNTPFGGSPTGNVTVTDGTLSCTGTVAAGNCTLTFLTAGPRMLSATYGGDANFAASPPTVGILQTVSKANTTTTISSNLPSPSLVGEPVAIHYSVGVTSPGGGTPAGNVTVSDGTESCTGAVAAGSCQIAFTLAGSKTLRATYQGDTNYNVSAPSPGVPQTVNKRNTAVVVSSSANPSVFGQSITFTAVVQTVPPGNGTPTGTVQFQVDGTNLGTAIALAAGSASISTAGLATGTHTVSVLYSGDANFNAGGGTLSPDQTVGKANTVTLINSHLPNPSLQGQVVTVSFSVAVSAPGAGTPAGSVTVTDGNAVCTAALSAGSCQIKFMSAGTKMLTAQYSGDANFAPSTSAPVTHVVSAPVTTQYLYLPSILNGYIKAVSGPKAGAWQSTTNDEFNVSIMRDSIEGFAIYISVPSCNITRYRITHTAPVPIVNGHASFSGSFYADVTFDSDTSAHGYDGLLDYTIPGCLTGSSGPWQFTATWQSSTPLPFPDGRGK